MRTCTVLTYTNGFRRTFTVMRGKMKGRYFDANSAEVLAKHSDMAPTGLNWPASVEQLRKAERDLTAQYATTAAPAVKWQA